jgi:hypothetical protein
MNVHKLSVLLMVLATGMAVALPARAEDAAPAVTAPQVAATDYLGIWKVQDGKQREFFITLEAGGKASSRWAAAMDQKRNEVGTWKEVNGQAVVLWGNGWQEVIAKSGEGYVKKAFAPKLTLDGAPSNEGPALKVDAIPAS